MKRSYHLFLTICLLLSSCSLPLEYNGKAFSPQTTHIDVFYSADDAKMDYIVMGRLTSHKYALNIVINHFKAYAKKLGGNGIIIQHADGSKPGRENRIYADVISYR